MISSLLNVEACVLEVTPVVDQLSPGIYFVIGGENPFVLVLHIGM